MSVLDFEFADGLRNGLLSWLPAMHLPVNFVHIEVVDHVIPDEEEVVLDAANPLEPVGADHLERVNIHHVRAAVARIGKLVTDQLRPFVFFQLEHAHDCVVCYFIFGFFPNKGVVLHKPVNQLARLLQLTLKQAPAFVVPDL